jgi:hypothetical protein
LIKGIETQRFGHGIYTFQTPYFRGFQLGDPERDRVAKIEGFDAQDHKIQIWVGAQKGAPGISQAQVNRVILSLKTVASTN